MDVPFPLLLAAGAQFSLFLIAYHLGRRRKQKPGSSPPSPRVFSSSTRPYHEDLMTTKNSGKAGIGGNSGKAGIGGNSGKAGMTLGGRGERSLSGVRVFVVESLDDWTKVEHILLAHTQVAQVLGLDCEWTSSPQAVVTSTSKDSEFQPTKAKWKRSRVSLLQLCTAENASFLIRLPLLHQSVLPSLVNVLQDGNILKVGVDVLSDSDKLRMDYNLTVRGCVDLRHIAGEVYRPWQHLGLKRLSENVSGIGLDKSYSVRTSNWDAPRLTQRQIDYAAMDAVIAIRILGDLLRTRHGDRFPFRPDTAVDSDWQWLLLLDAPRLLQLYGDQRFNVKSVETHSNKNKSQRTVGTGAGCKKKADGQGFSVRSRPLYENCLLLAPDGETLCTCDSKKATWYLNKGLGDKVNDSPLTVQLRFQPRGRPADESSYYLQVKENVCVVCGSANSCIRKHIVPRDYRRHFPLALKEHSSHDVVLVCVGCQRADEVKTLSRKRFLAQKYDAPLASGKAAWDESIKVKRAARGLLKAGDKIPIERRTELENTVKRHYDISALTKDDLEAASQLKDRPDNNSRQSSHCDLSDSSHGYRVVEQLVKKGELQEFQREWRQLFVETMKPRFLPPQWTVEYNHLRISRGNPPSSESVT